MCDGWINATKRQNINFMAYCDGEIFSVSVVDAFSHVNNFKYLPSLMKSVIKKINKEHVLQIYTNNRSTSKRKERS